jgi:hypothetical protein
MRPLLIGVFLVFSSSVTHSLDVAATEPCSEKSLQDYFQKVDRTMDEAATATHQLSITVFPSFSQEWGIRIDGLSIYLVEFGSSLWANSSAEIKPVVYRATLGQELIMRLLQRFGTAVANAHKADKVGLDGVGYRFLLRGIGCGQTWSPEPSSEDGRLIQITELLAEYAPSKTPAVMQRIEESILKLLAD